MFSDLYKESKSELKQIEKWLSEINRTFYKTKVTPLTKIINANEEEDIEKIKKRGYLKD